MVSADVGNVQGLCDDDVTVQQFCSRYVEPMGEESDHIQLVALTDALLVRTPTWQSQSVLGLGQAVSQPSQYSIHMTACSDLDMEGPPHGNNVRSTDLSAACQGRVPAPMRAFS